MLFALSLGLVTVVLAALGQDFESALVLAIAALSTTGPLTEIAANQPIALLEMQPFAKVILCAATPVGVPAVKIRSTFALINLLRTASRLLPLTGNPSNMYVTLGLLLGEVMIAMFIDGYRYDGNWREGEELLALAFMLLLYHVF